MLLPRVVVAYVVLPVDWTGKGWYAVGSLVAIGRVSTIEKREGSDFVAQLGLLPGHRRERKGLSTLQKEETCYETRFYIN